MIEEHYKENFKPLSKKAGRILGDSAYGEDCTQEAYEMALKYFKSFDKDKGVFDQWFNRIYTNTIARYINFIRDKGIVKDPSILEYEPEPLTILDEHRGLIYREIRKYGTENQQEVLILFVIKGYSTSDVSRIVDITPAQVSKTIQRFKQHLRNKYDIRSGL